MIILIPFFFFILQVSNKEGEYQKLSERTKRRQNEENNVCQNQKEYKVHMHEETKPVGKDPGLGVACWAHVPFPCGQALGRTTWPHGAQRDPMASTLVPLVLYLGETPNLIILVFFSPPRQNREHIFSLGGLFLPGSTRSGWGGFEAIVITNTLGIMGLIFIPAIFTISIYSNNTISIPLSIYEQLL